MGSATIMWIMIGVIAVCSIVARTVVKLASSSKTGASATARLDALQQQLEDVQQDLDDARGRIEVLEKIVTDQKYDLGRQIDNLAG